MKKILFSLVALVCSMSMNAQIMKAMKGNTLVAAFTAEQVDRVVFDKPKSDTAMRTGDIEVVWVQLWENGPKFAEYNVGAANNKAEDCGGYYCWGSSKDKDPDVEIKSGTDDLTGTDDTATNLWGSNWRMPTQAELKGLRENCDFVWTTVNNVKGWKFTGKGDYASCYIFLPAAGYWDGDTVSPQGNIGYYWSSTHYNVGQAYYLYMPTGSPTTKPNVTYQNGNRKSGHSIRAVLAED